MTTAIATMAKTTSKAFFTLRSLLTCEVRYADVPANATVAPTIIVTTFPEAIPLKTMRKPKIPQISDCHPLGNFLKFGHPFKISLCDINKSIVRVLVRAILIVVPPVYFIRWSNVSKLRQLEGERLILDVSPTPNFKRYVAVRAIIAELVILAMLNVIVTMTLYVVTGGVPITTVGIGPLLVTYAFSYLVLAAIVIALTLILTDLMYKKYHFWVADKRVVWRHGIIGYSITSVPLERISDVAVSRTFWERICGVGGVVVKEMGAVPK